MFSCFVSPTCCCVCLVVLDFACCLSTRITAFWGRLVLTRTAYLEQRPDGDEQRKDFRMSLAFGVDCWLSGLGIVVKIGK